MLHSVSCYGVSTLTSLTSGPMSYLARVKSEIDANPSLQPLLQFLSPSPLGISGRQARVEFIEYSKDPRAQRPSLPVHADLQDVITRVNASIGGVVEDICGCTLIIEDIQPRQVQLLGESLSIDPVFFAGYLGTNYRSVERHPLPPWATTLPSESATQEFCHIHYQRVIKLEEHFDISEKDLLISSTNVPRAVKRLPPLNGVDIAFARTCTSVLRKCFDSGFWICLIVVDSTTADVIPQPRTQNCTPTFRVRQTPLHSSIRPGMSFTNSSTAKILQAHAKLPPSEFDRLVASVADTATFSIRNPSMVLLCSSSLRFALREFLVYSATMHRYVKHYEYSSKDLSFALRGDDIDDLQIWRRRAFQTLQKLLAMKNFIEYWSTEEQLLGVPQAAWLIKDIQHLITAIEHHSRSLEAIIPVTMAMVQLVDMRRSVEEASHVKQLTYLALVFVPLSFVTGLFSMSEHVSPGSSGFWLYFVVAIPLLFLVLGASCFVPLRTSLARRRQKSLR
ncbi:hypothetical protein F5Y11DRAFT_236645 [Daldinia sp. FL1419]|nr:hypothetical protein F5Y11DRAFT_236645 [Daldinia sp. FL1419]